MIILHYVVVYYALLIIKINIYSDLNLQQLFKNSLLD